ncbi:hypothetical protein ABT390_05205 [Streptomyces aurantiacus]|uniref:Uncharacterized protein n=1 Tax=Streptomyces aurantiacus JA 4570 TaxID=1286094 RepID=S3ZSE7_9ACTN|nr:hypothetical protein STRAU_1280 [Streptomyces aurantiacus JA 4570]
MDASGPRDTAAGPPPGGSPTPPATNVPPSDTTPGASGTPAPPPGPPTPPPAADPHLAALAAELTHGRHGVAHLGPLPAPDLSGTAALWRWFHLTLLRLPAPHATQWRARAQQLPVAGGDPGGARWEAWRTLGEGQVLLPPLPRLGVPGVRLDPAGSAAPWAMAAAAGGEPAGEGTAVRGSQGVPPAPGDLRAPLGVFVVLAGWVGGLAALDGQLHHCLENVSHRGVVPLREAEHRTAHRHELAQRIGRLACREPGSAAELRAALAVDEALCSVLHLPPAAPGSWWAQLAETSQRAVLELRRRVRDSGADVAVEVLAPTYREARRRTGGNDIPLDAGGRKGQVLAGLRLWARIDGRELPGRVVYRA